ncbi:hypothetical protein HK101_002832 [Irineochytrium annulatum]|nr:hypothetical protein HK101_002832 [Irineochytrium annulatum]
MLAGNTPLHWACRGGHADVVDLLLAKKPAINSQNKLGDTPLHSAAWGGSVKVTGKLLGAEGIQTNVKNKDGATPLALAKGDDVAALLMQYQGSAVNMDMVGDDEDDD